eukprot:2992495-Amphidinium_carterae.1
MWLRGKTLVWNLAVSLDGKWAAGPAEIAELEVQAWNRLWQGDPVTQRRPRRIPEHPRTTVTGGPNHELVTALLMQESWQAGARS